MRGTNRGRGSGVATSSGDVHQRARAFSARVIIKKRLLRSTITSGDGGDGIKSKGASGEESDAKDDNE